MSAEPDFDHITVRNNEDEERYETQVGDEVATLYYGRDGQRLTLIHTEVPPALEGHGIAGKLARFALDDARARGLAVIPVCTYVSSYLRLHPDYLGLVPASARHLVTRDER
jgi:predicted GNAT family acetyltransferase